MNEARNNPTAQAKAEGVKSGFCNEIEDISVIVMLAEIGLDALKQFASGSTSEPGDREAVEKLIKDGPGVIQKFRDTADYLYARSREKENNPVK